MNEINARKSCCYCVLKHLSQALILYQESCLGYPRHIWLCLGHLAEAESEILEYAPGMAERIRDIRLCIQDKKPQNCSIQDLIWDIERFMEGENYGKNPMKEYEK